MPDEVEARPASIIEEEEEGMIGVAIEVLVTQMAGGDITNKDQAEDGEIIAAKADTLGMRDGKGGVIRDMMILLPNRKRNK